MSLDARRVNVSSRVRSAGTPLATSEATRAQSVVVFPVPAPARTSRCPSRCSAAARCSGFSSSSQSALSAASVATNIRSPNATVAAGRHAKPTLVIGGTGDTMFPPDALRAAVVGPLAQARLELVDCGHEIPLEAPHELAALIEGFLAGLD
jgi:pimeloyl-ACP methyl ester carboxylesterase